MTRWEQAVEGLEITKDGNVVAVNDGADRWLCWRKDWDATKSRLTALDAINLDADESRALVYTDYLCGAPEISTVASVIGESRGEYGPLVREAVSLGIIEPEIAMRAYGVEVQS